MTLTNLTTGRSERSDLVEAACAPCQCTLSSAGYITGVMEALVEFLDEHGGHGVRAGTASS